MASHSPSEGSRYRSSAALRSPEAAEPGWVVRGLCLRVPEPGGLRSEAGPHFKAERGLHAVDQFAPIIRLAEHVHGRGLRAVYGQLVVAGDEHFTAHQDHLPRSSSRQTRRSIPDEALAQSKLAAWAERCRETECRRCCEIGHRAPEDAHRSPDMSPPGKDSWSVRSRTRRCVRVVAHSPISMGLIVPFPSRRSAS